jgi:hypothetical protein
VGVSELPRDVAEAQQGQYLPVLTAVAQSHPNVVLRSILTSAVCDSARCTMFDPQGLLKFRDGDHISAQYAEKLEPLLAATLAPALGH